jgi:two-component system, LytTR family, response regulator LytT
LSQPRPLLTRQSLKGMELILPSDRFVRIHKSFIVNIQKISAVRRNILQVGAFEIPFSDSYKDALSRFLPEIRGL